MGWVQRLLGRQPTAPPISESVDEAAQQTLGKAAKIQTALEGVFTQQMHQIAQDEVEEVRAYKASKLAAVAPNMQINGPSGKSAGSAQPQRHSDLIIADHMEFNTPQPAGGMGVGPLLLAAALGAGTGGLGLAVLPALAPFLSSLIPHAAAPAAPVDKPAPPNMTPPQVKIDDLHLRVKWWIDEQGKVQTQVIELPAAGGLPAAAAPSPAAASPAAGG